MNDLAFFLITLSVLGAIIGAVAFRVGKWFGRGIGYDDGLKAGFLQGRRTEREGGQSASVVAMNVRDIASRHQLRLAAGLSQGGAMIRFQIDREGYCVGFEVMGTAPVPTVFLKMSGCPGTTGAGEANGAN